MQQGLQWISLSLPWLAIFAIVLIPGFAIHGVGGFLPWLGRRLAAKVNRANNGPHQQRIAGLLAALVLIIPCCLGLALFNSINPLSSPFDALLLVLLLNWQGPMNSFQLTALQLEQHQQARIALKPWLLRECQSLTSVGVAKAGIEMLLLRLAAQWFAPVFWYALAGIEICVLYVMVYQLHLSWNPKQSEYRQFGAALSRGYKLLSWLPFKLLALVLASQGDFRSNLQAVKQGFRWPFSGSGSLLSVTANNLKLELGGPRHYQGQRIEQAYFGPTKCYPSVPQMQNLITQLRLASLLFSLIIVPVYLLRHAL